MNRKTIWVSFAFVFLILATGLFVAPAQAVKPKAYRATFSCTAGGECLVLPYDYFFGPVSDPWFVGRGIAAFTGSAKVDQYPPSGIIPYYHYYTSSGINGLGVVSVRWGENTISVLLFSKGDAGGYFIDEEPLTDTFAVGFGAPGFFEGTQLVPYKGTIKDSTGTHAVSGKAVILPFQIGGQSLLLMNLHHLDGTVLSMLWLESGTKKPGFEPAGLIASQV